MGLMCVSKTGNLGCCLTSHVEVTFFYGIEWDLCVLEKIRNTSLEAHSKTKCKSIRMFTGCDTVD